MLRRVMTTVILASWVAIPAAAQTRATYVLSNGEKHNGVIVYGRGDNNIVDMKFHVNQSGQELVFEHSDVVVIDFVGGTPSSEERQALPNGTGVMVMRDGSVVRGQLHNIVKPDLVQWVNEGGVRNNYPIADVRRLYMNTDVAKSVFLNTAPAPAATSGTAQTRTSVFGGRTTSVKVDGNQQWVDTGIDVKRGDRVTFNASGQVEYGPNTRVTPSGTTGTLDRRTQTNANYPVAAAPGGSLIGKVGNGAPFPIGGGSKQVTIAEDGRLLLGVNDDNVVDNSGSFTVSIRH